MNCIYSNAEHVDSYFYLEIHNEFPYTQFMDYT